jgi:hypothetical protein
MMQSPDYGAGAARQTFFSPPVPPSARGSSYPARPTPQQQQDAMVEESPRYPPFPGRYEDEDADDSYEMQHSHASERHAWEEGWEEGEWEEEPGTMRAGEHSMRMAAGGMGLGGVDARYGSRREVDRRDRSEFEGRTHHGAHGARRVLRGGPPRAPRGARGTARGAARLRGGPSGVGSWRYDDDYDAPHTRPAWQC